MKQRDQFLLISKNIQLSNPQGSTTYEKLLNFWYGAMRTMEELLNGRPQSIRDRCIPSAIISWHLYPNLIVLTKPISPLDFQDSLIPRHATCEVGFVSSVNQEEQESMSRWSLTLSQYQFYGESVAAVSEENFTRVDIKRFSVIAFGAMLGSWYIPNKDILIATEWLLDLWNIMCNVLQLHRDSCGEGFEWFQCLVVGAKYFVDEGGLENKTMSQILQFGKRRGK